MDFTTDKLRSLVRKWQTLIEAQVDVKTTDGYLLRMFAIAFTKKRPGQVRHSLLLQALWDWPQSHNKEARARQCRPPLEEQHIR